MTSTVPERVQLGATTTIRKWYLDIDLGSSGTPAWTGVFGISNFQPNLDPTLKDSSDFDSNGYRAQDVTALAWAATIKVSRKVVAGSPTEYDPGQEALRLAAQQTGVANSVHVRFYEMEPGGPRVEAYEGNAAVSWSPDGGAMDDLDMVSVTLTGQGQRQSITHPDPAA